MAYSTENDVKLYALQAPDAANFAGYIAEADGRIDARLRTLFEVPFAAPDQLIQSISARMAAGFLLQAYYAQHSLDPSAYAASLLKQAEDDLERILANPGLLSQEVREQESVDEANCQVKVSDENAPAFGMGPEETWGVNLE